MTTNVNEDDYNVHTSGIFAIWWKKDGDYRARVEGYGQMLNEIRQDLLTDTSMIVKYYQKILTLFFF